MRHVLFSILILTMAFGLVADEIFIPIAGSVGVFSTDLRIVNPSADETIEIQATFLPAAGPTNHPDNSGRTAKTFTIPSREMVVFDDVVASLFQASGLGGIRFVSDGSFSATARIFATNSAGTLGQFAVGVPIENALQKGILLQLESTSAFRTNVGLLNPDRTAPAAVTLYLYDADNEVIATANVTLQPWGVIAPTSVTNLFPSASGDLSDAWVSYVADKPIIVYGSVIDNGTTDPTYVPAVIDTGEPPPQQVVRTFDVTAFQWGYQFEENGKVLSDVVIQKNARVIMRFTTDDVTHGFAMTPYVSVLIQPGTTRTVEFIADRDGTFTYFCTESSCGAGHTSMSGTLRIGTGTSAGPPGYAMGSHAGHEHHHHAPDGGE